MAAQASISKVDFKTLTIAVGAATGLAARASLRKSPIKSLKSAVQLAQPYAWLLADSKNGSKPSRKHLQWRRQLDYINVGLEKTTLLDVKKFS